MARPLAIAVLTLAQVEFIDHLAVDDTPETAPDWDNCAQPDPDPDPEPEPDPEPD